MLGKGHGGLYKAPTREERRKQKAKRRKRSVKFIDLRFERWQVVLNPICEEGNEKCSVSDL